MIIIVPSLSPVHSPGPHWEGRCLWVRMETGMKQVPNISSLYEGIEFTRQSGGLL